MSDNEEERERVTAESYGALETSDANGECWLIRIPPKLAQLMDAVPEGIDLGELVFTKGGKVPGKINPIKPSLTVHLREDAANFLESNGADDSDKKPSSAAAAATASLPLNYSLQAMTKKVPLMHPFTRNQNTGSVKILGQITRTANLQVEQDSNYRAMLKDRLVATNVTSQRFVKPVEATESILSKQQQQQQQQQSTTGSSRGFGAAVLEFGKRKIDLMEQQQMQQAIGEVKTKKARQFAPTQSLRSVAFELFSHAPYWSFKDLKAAAVAGGASNQLASKRGDKDLRDVLADICDYHRSGDHKNMWSLKKEFQHGGVAGDGS
ncbi:hypothetical protein MPSEU_000699800 [Mayamaea pseudoterrestris]|nr:hypothetical protein MPSEU_000699800 [Mayamaea pseudoterrestris]